MAVENKGKSIIDMIFSFSEKIESFIPSYYLNNFMNPLAQRYNEHNEWP